MSAHRSKKQVCEWVFRHADSDGFIDLTPKRLAAAFGWTTRRAERFLADHTADETPDSQELVRKGFKLIKLDTDRYYVVGYEYYKYLKYQAYRLKYKRRWDRKHRPSGWKRWKARSHAKPAAIPAQPF